MCQVTCALTSRFRTIDAGGYHLDTAQGKGQSAVPGRGFGPEGI